MATEGLCCQHATSHATGHVVYGRRASLIPVNRSVMEACCGSVTWKAVSWKCQRRCHVRLQVARRSTLSALRPLLLQALSHHLLTLSHASSRLLLTLFPPIPVDPPPANRCSSSLITAS